MSNLPERVLIHEEAPREGFQSEQAFIPTETKIAFIEALANTGVREVNCVLHDTRGLGLANAAAGLRLGVAHFDASCGGLGGLPIYG